MKLQRIMVAIKPWERGLPLAAQDAQLLAQAIDARIELVSSVFDAAIDAGWGRGEGAAGRARERAVAAARVELERLAGTVRACGGSVTTRIVWGTPAYEAIVGAAVEWRADLLVVCAHEPATRHSRLTDTDWQLMRRTPCPLLLVKNARFSAYRVLLAAVDAFHVDDESRGLDHAVLATSRCVARAFGSVLRLGGYRGRAAFDVPSAVEVPDAEAPHRRALAQLASQFDIPASDVDLIEGSPHAIVDLAVQQHAGLIVVGAAQRRGAASAAIGSAAEFVAGDAACDVLIVPPAYGWQVAATPRSQVG